MRAGGRATELESQNKRLVRDMAEHRQRVEELEKMLANKEALTAVTTKGSAMPTAVTCLTCGVLCEQVSGYSVSSGHSVSPVALGSLL